MDHAGHSQPPELWKDLANSPTVLWRASLSNSWSTAQAATATRPAMEDLWTTLSSSSRTTELFTRTNIPTKPSSKLAPFPQDPSRSQAMSTSRTATILPLPSLADQLPSQSMPPTGQHIRAESSTTARPNSTTECSSSVLPISTGGSRTHGETHGERKASLDLPEETPAVSATLPPIPPNDPIYQSCIGRRHQSLPTTYEH